MFPISILQGRLSPDTQNRFQFFPETWKEEFAIARDLAFTGIEWLVDADKWRDNPVFSDTFASAANGSLGVPVVSIAADWFMVDRLWDGDIEGHRTAIARVIDAAKFTVEKLVLIPLLEKNTIIETGIQERVIEVLRPIVPHLEQNGVRLAFETELPSHDLARFVDNFRSGFVGVYFDTGNCTSYGLDCPAEIRYLSHRIMGMHIKDRHIGFSQNVPLGTGDADFKGILIALKDIGWRGHLVMQAWRGEQYIQDAQRQLGYIDRIQSEVFV